LNSILHFLTSCIVSSRFIVSVPALGEGISHLGQRILATFAKSLISAGSVKRISKFIVQSSISLRSVEDPTISAQSFLTSSTLSSEVNTAILTDFHVP